MGAIAMSDSGIETIDLGDFLDKYYPSGDSWEEGSPSGGGNTDRRLSGKQAQASGSAGEDIAAALLVELGVKMVADVATPFVIIGRHSRDKRYVRIAYKEKVMGDINGQLENGIRVLAEVKSRKDDRLSIGALSDGQINALNECVKWNGLALVVWIAPHGNYVIKWPVPDDLWKKGKRLTIDVAVAYQWGGLRYENVGQRGQNE